MIIASSWLVTFFLVFIRLSTVLLFTPLQAIRLLPRLARFLLVLFLSLFFSLKVTQASIDNDLLSSALSEFANGLVLSMALYAGFSVLTIVGHLLDNQLGLNSSSIFNPSEKAQESLSSRWLPMLAMLIFFSTNCHHRLLEGLLYSFKSIAPGQLLLFHGFNLIITQFALMFALAFAIASPIILALVAIELAGGLLTRHMPQISTYFLTLPLKIIVGLVLMLLLLGLLNPVLNELFNQLFTQWQGLMQ